MSAAVWARTGALCGVRLAGRRGPGRACVLGAGHGLWHRDVTGLGWRTRPVPTAAGPDLGMSLSWSVSPAGRAALLLRCGVCDAESRRTGSAFVHWQWQEPLVSVVSVAATAAAHQMEIHDVDSVRE